MPTPIRTIAAIAACALLPTRVSAVSGALVVDVVPGQTIVLATGRGSAAAAARGRS
ncbi:MAG: hypothetical protein NVSMB21_25930 [Vulcanimicrobiaceae bacterium]